MNIEQVEEQLINIEAATKWGDECMTLIKWVLGHVRETAYFLDRNSSDSDQKKGALNLIFYDGGDPFSCVQQLHWLDRCLEVPKSETDQVVLLMEEANLDQLSYINYRAELASTGLGAIRIVAQKVSDECHFIKQHILTRDTEQLDVEGESQGLTDIERELRDINSDLLNRIEGQFKAECARTRKYLTAKAVELKRVPDLNLQQNEPVTPQQSPQATGESVPSTSSGIKAENRLPEVASANMHSPDFRSIRWDGEAYSFTAHQSRVVEILWRAWNQGTPDISGAHLLTESGSQSSSDRLRDLFQSGKHPAWGKVIVDGSTKGSYRLK